MKIDIAKNLKKINLFFWLLILSLIAVNGISILIKKYFEFPDFIEAGNLFLYVNPLSMIICILLGYFVYNKFVEKGKNEEDNDLKFKIYLKAQKIKYLLFTLSGVISAFTLLAQYRQENIFIPAILLLFFLMNVPTENRFNKDYLGLEE